MKGNDSMFIPWNDKAVRLTGRWTRLKMDGSNPHVFTQPTARYSTTTAAGSYFELAFEGNMVILQFDLGYLGQPYPHLWIRVDDGASIEVPVDRYLRVEAPGYSRHVVRVTYKGGMEMLPRWYSPLMGAISFIGAQADAAATLPDDNRRIIEFIGDSITEGVLVDADYDTQPANMIDQFNRPYQDDTSATYASLTAQALNLRPIFQAYGAVGMTRSGCGSVPRAGLIYPYVYDGVPYTGDEPEIVVINHGANDRGTTAEEYIKRYAEFIDQVRNRLPHAIIVCLSAFCGAFDSELGEFVVGYCRTHAQPIHFISSKGWVPLEPLHPLRAGHRVIASKLIPLLNEII
jgi:hypothetical protein